MRTKAKEQHENPFGELARAIEGKVFPNGEPVAPPDNRKRPRRNFVAVVDTTKPEEIAALDENLRQWVEDHRSRGVVVKYEVQNLPGVGLSGILGGAVITQIELTAGRYSRIVTGDIWPLLVKVRQLFESDESNSPGYTDTQHGGIVGDETAQLWAVAADAFKRGLSVAELKEAIEDKLAAKGEVTERETTGRATAAPRLKWEKARLPDEDPADFAARAGYEHRGMIHDEDRALSVKLSNWLRTHKWPEDVPYIPTKPEWIERQLAKLGEAPRPARVRTDETRLYEAARYRAAKV